MKDYKKFILLAAAAIILFAAYRLAISKKNADSALVNSRDIIKLTDTDASKLNEIKISNKDGKFVISKEGKAWKLTEPSSFKYDQGIIDGLPLAISYLSAKKLISENPEDLSQYGLDKPSEIFARLSDGKTYTIHLGNQTSTKDGYYTSIEGSKKVYVIENSKAEPFLITKSSLRDTNVLAIKDFKKLIIRVDYILSIVLEKNGRKVFSANKSEDGTWKITSPIEEKVDKKKLLPILNAISKTRAKYFVENPGSLNEYGLEKPRYSISFQEEEETKKTLYIGSEKVSGSEFYAMVKGSDDVFVLDEAGFDFLDKSLDEILN